MAHHRVYGYPTPVAGASLRAVPVPNFPNNLIDVDSWPWFFDFGIPWTTDASGAFPNTLRVRANYPIQLFVLGPQHLGNAATPVMSLPLGESTDVGDILLPYLDEISGANGIPDLWEFEQCGGIVDPMGDKDMDFATNRDEWLAGTDPESPASVFTMPTVQRTEQGVRVTWTVENGRDYRVLSLPSLFASEFEIEAGPFTADAFTTQMSWLDTEASSATQKIYAIQGYFTPF